MNNINLLATVIILFFSTAAGEAFAFANLKIENRPTPSIYKLKKPTKEGGTAAKVKYLQDWGMAVPGYVSWRIEGACETLVGGKTTSLEVLDKLKTDVDQVLAHSDSLLKHSKELAVVVSNQKQNIISKINKNPNLRKAFDESIQVLQKQEDDIGGLVENVFPLLQDRRRTFLEKTKEWEEFVNEIGPVLGAKIAADRLGGVLQEYRLEWGKVDNRNPKKK
jgi:hypothetical protein